MHCKRRVPYSLKAYGLGVILALATANAGCNKNDQASAEKAQREAADKVQQTKLDADEKIAAAKRDAEKAAQEATGQRTDARATLQKDVDAVDRKISYLKERASTVKGAAKKNSTAAQTEVDTRRATLKADFAKLETESGAAWDSAKAAVERDITAVKSSVDSWESTVTDKPAH